MDPDVIAREYQSRLSTYEHLRGEALFILDQALGQTDIKLHSISSRVKKLQSFIDKTQRKQSNNPFGDIQDVVGIRVVCLFLSDIERIGELIQNAFSVLSEDNKIEGADVSSFGYMSFHFIVMMREEYSGPRYAPISRLPFEIQVRTIAMDAWANVSHYLDYKSDQDVPSELRRDFYALSGLFYVADRHFEMFYTARKDSQERMVELFKEASPQTKAEQEINFDSLDAYLQERFPEREHADAGSVSMLVDELLKTGYKTIGDVDSIVNVAYNAFLKLERESPPHVEGSKYADTGVLRTCAGLVNDAFLGITSKYTRGDKEERNQALKQANEKYAKYRNFLKQ